MKNLSKYFRLADRGCMAVPNLEENSSDAFTPAPGA